MQDGPGQRISLAIPAKAQQGGHKTVFLNFKICALQFHAGWAILGIEILNLLKLRNTALEGPLAYELILPEEADSVQN